MLNRKKKCPSIFNIHASGFVISVAKKIQILTKLPFIRSSLVKFMYSEKGIKFDEISKTN